MTEDETPLTDQAPGQGKPTAAHKALRERKALAADTLVHGAYYNGLLGDTTMVGRRHAHNCCFVFWEHEMGEPKLKAAPHVAEAAAGAHFAPFPNRNPKANITSATSRSKPRAERALSVRGQTDICAAWRRFRSK